MDSIGSILSSVLQKKGLKGHADASLVVSIASEYINKHLPQCSEMLSVTSLKGEVLHISSQHPIASQELHQITNELLIHLQEQSHLPPVSDVRVFR